jgi:glycosyltransferase involved in cell wall biosynthesis
MRILVLTKRQYMGKDLLDDRFGRFRELPIELAKLGHEVSGICFSYRSRNQGSSEDTDPDTATRVKWRSVNLGWLILPGLSGYIFKVRGLIRQFEPDLIWACSDAFHAILGVWLAKQVGKKCVVDLYDHFEAFPATRLTGVLPLFKQAVRSADGISCFSQRLADRVLGYHGPKVNVVVIENGVRTDLFYPRDRNQCRKKLGLPERAKIIGTAGALYRARSIDTLFRAFELLFAQDDSFHLAIAGPREPCVRIPGGPNVHDFGTLPWDQVPLLISALDVAVSCYKDSEIGRYSFPQKAYEILACRRPIVSAAVGTMKDLLSVHEDCLFEPDSPEGLAKAVGSQLKKPTIPEIRVPSWADSAKQLSSFLEKVLDGQRR